MSQPIVPLSAVPTGRWVRIIAIYAGWGLARRLYEMGLLPGSMVFVEYNDGRGQVIIRVRGYRLGLGRGVAAKVMVQVI